MLKRIFKDSYFIATVRVDGSGTAKVTLAPRYRNFDSNKLPVTSLTYGNYIRKIAYNFVKRFNAASREEITHVEILPALEVARDYNCVELSYIANKYYEFKFQHMLPFKFSVAYNQG